MTDIVSVVAHLRQLLADATPGPWRNVWGSKTEIGEESAIEADAADGWPVVGTAGLVGMPFLMSAANSSAGPNVRSGADPIATQTTAQDRAVVVPPFAVVPNRANGRPRAGDGILPSFCTGVHHMVVSPSALISLQAAATNVRHLAHIARIERGAP